MIRLAASLLAAACVLTGCVSLRTMEQERVDQGRLLLDGSPDPAAPRKTRKIVRIDVELPGPASVPPQDAPPGPPPTRPEEQLSVIPMKGIRDEESARP